MFRKSGSGDKAQLSLFDLLGLTENLVGKYSSYEIEEDYRQTRRSQAYRGKTRRE